MVVGRDDKVVGRVDAVVGVVVDVAGCRVDKVVVGRVELVEGQVVVDVEEACKASLQLSQTSEEGGRLNHVGGGAVSGGVGVGGG